MYILCPKLCKSRGGLKLHKVRIHNDVDMQEEDNQNISFKENVFTDSFIKEQLRCAYSNLSNVRVPMFFQGSYLAYLHVI